MRSFIIPLVSLLSAFSVSAQSTAVNVEDIVRVQPIEGAPPPPAVVLPKPGQYVGVATIVKMFPEGLTSKVTLKAYANVKESGELTILPVVPESPLAATNNPESTLSRGVLQTDGSYLMDGKFRGSIGVQGDTFQLGYSTPHIVHTDSPLQPWTKVPMSLNYLNVKLILETPVTMIHYRFTPQVQPRLLRTR